MIGEVVDGHQILRPLGVGGMGEVYLAASPDGSLRAFKVVRADRDPDGSATGRFRREVLALGKLRHPNIVQILDAGRLEGSGALYLGMEYVAGPDLQAAIGWDGTFPVGDALAILAQLAAALAYAHAAGIVHRDLKPSNVILADGDPHRAKIIDFGLAKIAADEGLTRLTDDHDVLGSPLYWAPEQSNTAKVGPAADVYALGGIAYFLLTGEPLFKARPAVAMVYAHVHEVPTPLSQRVTEQTLPRGLDQLIAACVAKDPAVRPSAMQLQADLERLRWEVPSSADAHLRIKRAQKLFTTTGLSNMEQAITSQIRQVLLEIAAVMERPTDDIERVQNELSELELDLAMLDSEVQAGDAGAAERREAIAGVVARLTNAIADAYRQLFDNVSADRASAPFDAQALFVELDSLVDQYRQVQQ
ncbi:MAG TPA: serine/threonine-protein kinase [Kofleriaceae bacterium]|jgi:serine/threonine protein kinase